MKIQEMVENSKNDDSSYKDLYLYTIDKVFRHVLLRVKNRSDALDISQDVYVDLWRAIEKFEYQSDAEFYSFLFTIVRRKIFNFRRSMKNEIDIEDVYDIAAEESEKEDYRSLMAHIAKLKDNERMVIELRYFGDLSFGEIADLQGISENNAKVLHHRALKKLKIGVHMYE